VGESGVEWRDKDLVLHNPVHTHNLRYKCNLPPLRLDGGGGPYALHIIPTPSSRHYGPSAEAVSIVIGNLRLSWDNLG